MRIVLLSLVLTGCATMSAQDELPSRRAFEDALVASLTCEESETVVCHNQPRRMMLSRLDCGRSGERGRILCVYAGRMSWHDGSRGAVPSECAYLLRNVDGVWRIDSYPDAEVCGP